MKTAIVHIAMACVLLLLAGCGRGLVGLGTRPPGFETDKDFPTCLVGHNVLATIPTAGSRHPDAIDYVAMDAALVDELYRRPLPLTRYDEQTSSFVAGKRSALWGYLDCLLGPANDDNPGAQLLRGHILLTLMTQYGAELVRASRSDRQPAQALRVISHVREAELLLVAGLPALGPKPAAAAQPSPTAGAQAPPATGAQLGAFWIAARITATLQVAIDVEGVYFRRSLDLASSLVTAVGSGPAAAGQVRALVKQAGNGLQLTQRSEVYGMAFIADSRASLGAIDATNPTSDDSKVAAQWGLWSARLDAACADLATLAKLSDPSCRPTTDAVIKLRAGMGSAPPIRDSPPAKVPGGG